MRDGTENSHIHTETLKIEKEAKNRGNKYKKVKFW